MCKGVMCRSSSQWQPKLKAKMSNGDDGRSEEMEEKLELEAKLRDDSSWHPCRISVSPDHPGDHLIVRFQSCDMEDVLLHNEEVLTHLRFRSTPLQVDDCSSIVEGETILAAHNLKPEKRFYDAEVERVQKVRHSKRCCRCSFMIKWLDQDIQAGSLTVPSRAVRKLATNSITMHPLIVALLNSPKDSDKYLSDASPLSDIIKDSDSDRCLDALLQKQIEQINNMVDVSISDPPGAKLPALKGRSPTSASRFFSSLVPGDCNKLRSESRASTKTEVHIHEHALETKVSESLTNLAGNRVHLSPLASRAALASSLLNTKRCLVIDFNCCADMPTNEKLSLDGAAIAVKAMSKPVQIVLGLMSTNSTGPEKPQLTEKLPSLLNKSGNTGTLPRESFVHDAENATPDSEKETAEDANSTLDDSSDENKTTGLVTSGAQTKPSGLQNSYASSANQVRFTRSAQHNSSKNLTEVQMKIDNDKEKRVLRSKRNLASSSTLGDRENLTTKVGTKLEQISGLEPFESIDDIPGNKVSTPVKKRKEISSELKSNKDQMAYVAETPPHSQGPGCHQISQDQKRKATKCSKKRRVSPRIGLPQTRSQAKPWEY